MCDGGHGRRGGARGERAKPVTCATGMRAITMGHLLESLSTTPRNHHPSSTMLTSKKSSPSSGVIQGEFHQRELHQPVISFLSPREWVGAGESGDSPERGIARFEARRLGRMENEQHVRDGWERRATINGRGYGAVSEGLAAKRNLMADVTEGHNDSGGAPSHGRENGGSSCALRPEHCKMVRLLGRRCSGATKRRSKNSWKRTSREGGDGDWMTELTKMI
ncbi:putative sialic acid-binding Ig-like lectin 13 [Sesbania bispinosa]|nr:putative sialic acid-binding Ig-like lectin 13 [Sesbania bispinosa]